MYPFSFPMLPQQAAHPFYWSRVSPTYSRSPGSRLRNLVHSNAAKAHTYLGIVTSQVRPWHLLLHKEETVSSQV